MTVADLEQYINIKDLILDQPRSESDLPFDPKKEISEEDIARLELKIKTYQQGRSWWKAAEMLVSMQMLFSERNQEAFLSAEQMAGQTRLYERLTKIGAYYTLIAPAADFKLLFPDQFGSLNVTSMEADAMYRSLGGYYSNKEWSNYASLATSLLILFPDLKAKLRLDDNLWRGVNEDLEHNLDAEPYFYAEKCKNLKILYPDKGLAIPPEAWDRMEQRLQLYRDSTDPEALRYFANLASWMKILTTKEVKITDRGLELVMPEPHVDSTSQAVPETRRF